MNNVYIFDDSMDMLYIQGIIDNIGKKLKHDEFSFKRYAFLFKPGTYTLDITLEYYMHAIGLGQSPRDVIIHGSVQSITTTNNGNVTIMFWRIAENFTVIPKDCNQPVIWAVSQAAPYRRMNIKGDLIFDQNGWASGGYLGNSVVEGRAGTRSGQQWFTINSEIDSWYGGEWNRFFIGTNGAPNENWPDEPTTTLSKTYRMREKPFLTLNNNRLGIFKPELKEQFKGVTWKDDNEIGEWISLDDFYITDCNKDNSSSLNQALKQGKHLLITPGIYYLDQTLVIDRENTIIFGLGLASLIPKKGLTVIEVKNVDGVSISGLIIEASKIKTKTLVIVGEKDSGNISFKNPISIHDLICRVGGMIPGKAKSCIEIYNNDVVLDHLWLWRADHGNGVGWEDNRCANGIIVKGDRVQAYGLFVEHFQEYQTLWLGEDGKTFFYQSELPYDPPNQSSWQTETKRGYSSYKVGNNVIKHEAYGLGIYAFLGIEENSDKNVFLDSAVEAPEKKNIIIKHITCFSKGYGVIFNCLNNLGGRVNPGDSFFF